jgi:Flp pilus assembly pilin Flp
MNHAVLTWFRRFFRDQRGAGLVEYIMLAGLVAIASIFAFRTFGEKVQGAVDKQGGEVEKLGSTAK